MNSGHSLETGKPPQIALDGVNLAIAGMRDGVGPLLTLFLVRESHLNPFQLSVALAAPSLTSLIFQIPVGICFDFVSQKPLLLGLAAAVMIASCILLSVSPSFASIVAAQASIGVAMAFFSVGIPALSLVTVGKERLGKRLARNEALSKIGNFISTSLTGLVAQLLALRWVFYTEIALSISVISLIPWLPKDSVHSKSPRRLRHTWPRVITGLTKGWFWRLLLLSFLYQFSNAPIMMVFEQHFAKTTVNGSARISGAVLFTQVIIVLTALALGKMKEVRNPKPFFLLGFLLIVLRAGAYWLDGGTASLISGQLLDGVIAGILIIIPIRMIATLDTEEFNLLSSVFGTFVSLGASLSVITAGAFISWFGNRITFLCLGSTALAGFILTTQVRFPSSHTSSEA